MMIFPRFLTFLFLKFSLMKRLLMFPSKSLLLTQFCESLTKKLLAVTLTTWYNLLANRCMKLHGFPARICYCNVLTLWKNSKLKGVEVDVTSSRDQLLPYSTSRTVSLPLFSWNTYSVFTISNVVEQLVRRIDSVPVDD